MGGTSSLELVHLTFDQFPLILKTVPLAPNVRQYAVLTILSSRPFVHNLVYEMPGGH